MTNDLRVVKTGSCASLSGTSKLTYELACGPASDLHVRIAKSTGAGAFSKDWVAWERLQAVLEKNAPRPITSHTLTPIFKGLSVNTPGFLLAALKHEGLVRPMQDRPRCYELQDAAAFFAELQALMGAPTKKARPAATAKKAPGKARPAKKP
jgi:hypothetical protein